MKLVYTRYIVLMALIIVLPHSAAAELCRVIEVIDGDTLALSCEAYNGLVGLDGIDAPEMEQSFGLEAKEYLQQIVGGQELILLKFTNSTKKGVLIMPSGRSVGTCLVEYGLAWATDRKDSLKNHYIRYEKAARDVQEGLWSQDENQAPWDYREMNQIVDDELLGFDESRAVVSFDGSSGMSLSECYKMADPVDRYNCRKNNK
jgi:micrococcal nuclease